MNENQSSNDMSGKDGGYWRSLRELAAGEDFPEKLHREFPIGAAEWQNDPSRRQFLKLMAASFALSGATACHQPEEKILPYVEMPEEIVPGKPLFYATAMPFGGYGCGLVVESHMGRPTKIEGNGRHPASLGATSAQAQASILNLYDPVRSQAPRQRGRIKSRKAFLAEFRALLQQLWSQGGEGLRILTERVTSPTLGSQLERLLTEYPGAKWHQYEPVFGDSVLAGAELAFGEPVQTLYHFDRADVVLSLGADFLDGTGWPIPYARHFMQRRRVLTSQPDQMEMSRLYVVQSTPTLTGAKADHRLPLSTSDLERLTRVIAARLGVPLGEAPRLPSGVTAEWVDAVVDDLRNYRLGGGDGASLVVAGYEQSPEVHALVHAMNAALGNTGKTVTYVEPVEARPESHVQSLESLTAAIAAQEVQLLLVLDGNVAASAPADLEFAAALQDVPHSVHVGLYRNATADLCRWHLPAQHYLESWSDVRAYEGTASLVQPLIAPLYSGWSPHVLLGELLGEPDRSAYDWVRSYWEERLGADDFESRWEEALREGVIAQTGAPEISVTADAQRVASGVAQAGLPLGVTTDRGEVEVLFRPDPTIWDGRFAQNAWLQELPKPFTKLTWDNAALVSPQLAAELGLDDGDMVKLSRGEREVELPIWRVPGQATRVVTLHFGYGEGPAGPAGFDVFGLRSRQGAWALSGVKLQPLEGRYKLANTQEHFLMEGRHPIEAGTLAELKEDPEHPHFMHHAHHPEASFFPDEWSYDGYKWGMAVNLTACTGCNACVMACQAENNIPVVGKDQVAMGREMHWIRIDTYYQNEETDPDTYLQPVACMHCEKAPCEVVCPVAATTHSDEGVNEMTYNRCVGTRYCANNCPYKVRRFNFLQYTDDETPVLKLLRNPNVTVRSRGVMEKCTYCVQRLNAARIEAMKQDDPRAAMGVETACQAACPTQAIAFGDLNNSEAAVKAWKELPINYALLEDLSTKPRTTYLASLTNPNPRIQPSPPEA